jgi:transposase
LLTHGARAVLRFAQRRVQETPDRATALQRWAVTIVARCGYNKAVIAVANKLARTIWVVWAHDVDYQANPRGVVAA